MEEKSQKDEASNPGKKCTEEKVTRGNGQRKNGVANEKERRGGGKMKVCETVPVTVQETRQHLRKWNRDENKG